MNLKSYFTEHKGTGILATADGEGRVNAAIYARPQVAEDGSLVMIMRDRLTRSNLQQNPHAAYLFIEQGPGYRGMRLFLRWLREDDDPELIAQMTRPWLSEEEDAAAGPKYLTWFAVDKVLSLVGGEEISLD
ncbi:MAG: pyridoxamine 5'-phosphate oxidase family protein [Deltaproteobacteria bacterium]|nr:MAG: pyridoxamine 5'-phosphate oxidase family protein [Deltaproteobacteria bacterium]